MTKFTTKQKKEIKAITASLEKSIVNDCEKIIYDKQELDTLAIKVFAVIGGNPVLIRRFESVCETEALADAIQEIFNLKIKMKRGESL